MTDKPRVLIVDNEARSRDSLKALLGAWQQVEEVREASNGMEAIELVEAFQPQIVLMDVRMPKLNGLEAAWIMKSRWPSLKVVLLSMHPGFEAEALSAGVDVFIVKSDPPETLRKALMEVFPKALPPGNSDPNESETK
jgi:YesN/AraC family two-component response regulator